MRDTFALLLRHHHGKPATLSADAERAIRRRITMRRVGRLGALAVVGSFGTVVVAGAFGATEDPAPPSPTPTPTIGTASATFPVLGIPEFASATAEVECGDPIPAPHPSERDVSLALATETLDTVGETVADHYPTSWASGVLTQESKTQLGDISTSGVSYVVAKDGVVVGVLDYSHIALGWNTPVSIYSGPIDFSAPLLAEYVRCPGSDEVTDPGLEPGTYEIVAMAKVFSTPASVALSQVLGSSGGTWYLDPASLDPEGIYLPGSFDCAQTIAQSTPALGCLPDFTPEAAYHEADRTVTLLYNSEGLVEEFSTVLVSHPLTVTIIDAQSAGWGNNDAWESLGRFDSLDDFTCGASAGYYDIANTPGENARVSTSILETAGTVTGEGGVFDTVVLPTGVRDGSLVELLPGARVVYLQNTDVTLPDNGGSASTMTVVGSADASMARGVAADRFAGPQPATLTVGSATVCPGLDAGAINALASPLLVGTWRIVEPDGTIVMVDAAADLSWGYSYDYFTTGG